MRQKFIREIGPRCNVILFDDAPQVAKSAAEHCGDNCLFILRDAGHNPIVLGDVSREDLPAMARRVVAARIGPFMGDKAGTDAIFVPHHLTDSFVEALCLHLRGSDHLRRIKVVDPRTIDVAMAFACVHPQQRKNAPVFDFEAREMSPLVTLGAIDDVTFIDFSGPVFNIIAYATAGDLQRYFDDPAYRLRRMWASLLGLGAAQQSLLRAEVLLNETVAEHQDAVSSAAFRGQVGSAILRRSQVEQRPVSIAKALKTYVVCQQTAPAQVRQDWVVRALRGSFHGSMENLQSELGGVGWRIASAWCWGESALDNFLPGAPVRCMVVIEPSSQHGRSPTDHKMAVCTADSAPSSCGLAIRYGNVAARMAHEARLPASREHSTIFAQSAEIIETLTRPLSLLGPDASRLEIGTLGWHALLTVEALADPTQAFWDPANSSLAPGLRAQASLVYAAWRREFWAAVRAEGSLLSSLLGPAHLTSLEAQPLVLSNILRA